jgi:phytoene synthase
MPIALQHPERSLAIGYAPADLRAPLATLFALDERLAGIVARANEPMIGLMRLIWWRDALARLGTAPPPAEPLLVAAADLAALGVTGAALADMVAGWEALIDDPALGEEAAEAHARGRGTGLFRLAGTILSATPEQHARLALAGEGWARVDLARHIGDKDRAAAILASARMPLEAAMKSGWPRPLRPLAQLAMLALDDVRRGVGRWRAPASPARLLRVLRFQTIGR